MDPYTLYRWVIACTDCGCGQLPCLHQVDGIERDKIGLDLYEMAEVIVSMGLYQAVVSSNKHNRAITPSVSMSSRIWMAVAVVCLYTKAVLLASQPVLTQPSSVNDELLVSYVYRVSNTLLLCEL